MPNVIVLLASEEIPDGRRSIPLSDRATVALALAGSRNAVAYFSADDATAAEFAFAAGILQVESLPDSAITNFDLAMIGEAFVARYGDDFAGRLAEESSAALIFDVLSCDELSAGVRKVIRDAGRGAREVIELSGPAVLVISPSASRPGYVSRFRRLQARKAMAHSTANAAIAESVQWQPVRLRTRKAVSTTSDLLAEQRMDAAFGVAAKAESVTGPIVADPATCARHLVRYLAHHGFLPPIVSAIEGGTPLRLGEGRGSSFIATPVEDSGVHQPTTVSSRPRRLHDLPQRQRRQPRLIV